MPKNKQKVPQRNSDSFLEQLKELPSDTVKTIKKDLIKDGAKAAWSQFWGVEQGQASIETAPSIEEAERKEKPQKKSALELDKEFVVFSGQERFVARQMEEIRRELEAIIMTMAKVEIEVQKAVMEIPVKPGVYHINFLQRLRSALILIRENMESSVSWLKKGASRKKQKGYWNKYKKHGTTFGLSGERTLATQTG